MTRRDRLAVAGVLLAFAAAVAVTDPRGNFPLDDDWDFTLTTWNFVHTGVIQHTPFTSAVAVLQYLWGALWTLAFGESCGVLRASTLALALCSMLLVYAILRRAGVTECLAAFGALALFFNPLVYWASFTYMTHVPELVLSVGAFALFAEALRRESDGWLAAAVTAAVASFFIRQVGILNAAAPLVAAVAFRDAIGPRWKRIAAAYGAATALFTGLMLSGVLIVSREELKLHMQRFGGGWNELLMSKVVGPAHYGFFNVQNAAFFFLPLALLALRMPFSRRVAGVLFLWFGAIVWHMLAIGRPMPYPMRGNVFVDFTLGPLTLRDTFVFRMPYPFHAASGTLALLTVVTGLLAIAVGAVIITALRRSEVPLLARVAALYCVCGTVVVMIMRLYFDRYSIDAMWPFAILVPLALGEMPRRALARLVPAAALALMMVVSIAGTAEYLAWNRARWEGFHWLQSHGATLEQMDAGYEINALLAMRTGRKSLGKPGFAVLDDRYILAFNERVPGYEPLARFPYPRILGRDGAVFAMRRLR